MIDVELLEIMKRFVYLEDAKQALEEAHFIMSSVQRSPEDRLQAMMTAFAAERALEMFQKEPRFWTGGIEVSDPKFWYEQHDKVRRFYDAYVAAKRCANEAYLLSMKAAFDELPGELKEAMDASFNPVYGWSFITEY
jgi:hypothetical protein